MQFSRNYMKCVRNYMFFLKLYLIVIVMVIASDSDDGCESPEAFPHFSLMGPCIARSLLISLVDANRLVDNG